MTDRRSRLFWLGALSLAGISMISCAEDDAIVGGNKTSSTNSENVQTGTDTAGSDISKKVPAVCRNSQKCETSKECIGDAAYIACRCVVEQRCSDDPQCKGISDSGSDYTCSYECGKKTASGEDTCAWNVCRNTPACENTSGDGCTVEATRKDPNGDADGDGLSNAIENSFGYNPCDKDTDGDGVEDGLEDLNGNGKVDTELGETDPKDASSKPNTTNGEATVRAKICKKSEMLNGKNYDFNKATVATFNSTTATYREVRDNITNDIVTFEDSKTGVNALYYMSNIHFESKNLLKTALSDYTGEGGAISGIFEESSFKAAVPLDSWLGYDKENLQIIPDHEVQRVKTSIHADKTKITPRMVRDAIAKKGFGNTKIEAQGFIKEEACDTDEIKLYLARSKYDKGNSNIDNNSIFSIGVACAASLSGDTSIQMDDIISGTMVAPNDYEAFKSFVCQTKSYGDSTGMIDFIWIVDNSGSMVDEQRALTKTADSFMNQLTRSGIDYRIAVAFTDSYTVDEAQPNTGYHFSYPKDQSEQTSLNGKRYVYENGVRFWNHPSFNATPILSHKSQANSELTNSTLQKIFSDEISAQEDFLNSVCDRTQDFENMNQADVIRKNICGYGIEDGLKSLEVVLKRLHNPPASVVKLILDFGTWETDGKWGGTTESKIAKDCMVGKDVAPNCYTTDDSNIACFDELKEYYEANVESNKSLERCITILNSAQLRDNALKYVVWVSDEQSRQFKEDGKIQDNVHYFGEHTGSAVKNQAFPQFPFCDTGYKIEVAGSNITEVNGSFNPFKTSYGPCYPNAANNACGPTPTGEANIVCNPKNNDRATDAGKEAISETSSLPALAADYKATYNILSYYLASYVQYAGAGGIAGFAIVGDDFTKSGACKELTRGSYNGADYGYDYILTARHLGSLEKNDDGLYVDKDGNFNFTGKEGGFGSICNSDLDGVVKDLMDDAISRVAAHNLKGYPISSTIKVAIKNESSTTATILKRNSNINGWYYDPAQNGIILQGVEGATASSYLAIAYVIWSVRSK